MDLLKFKTSGKLSTYIQARARTALRAKHSKVWNASYKWKTPTTTTIKLLYVSRRMSRKCLCVFVNFHLLPQITDNCNYVELLSIWTPKRVMKLTSHTASHYALVHTALVQRSRLVVSEQGEPAASYVRTHYITFAMSVARWGYLGVESLRIFYLPRLIGKSGLQLLAHLVLLLVQIPPHSGYIYWHSSPIKSSLNT
jgi:hypothetical protein